MGGPTPGACQNQFWAPLILQGCSPSGLPKIRFVCVEIREIHTVSNYLIATVYYRLFTFDSAHDQLNISSWITDYCS